MHEGRDSGNDFSFPFPFPFLKISSSIKKSFLFGYPKSLHEGLAWYVHAPKSLNRPELRLYTSMNMVLTVAGMLG